MEKIMKDKEDIVVLKTYTSFPEAEKDRNTLEKNGIESFIADDSSLSMINGSPGEYRLSVRKADKKKAESDLGK